ncbi:hypothetical protein K502DRAFT_324985 [Neoconidiobolus thromboides FSU 785]|nr:hypothetical protein K502DRAFT_324985 [Neoconidiobolus thromboides FSU 785]
MGVEVNNGTNRSFMDFSVDENELYPFVLRCVILTECLTERLNQLNNKDGAGDSNQNSQANPKQNEKLLEQLVKSLKKHIGDIKKSSLINNFQSIKNNKNFIICLKSFHNFLAGVSTREVTQKIGNIEALIMIFTKYSNPVSTETKNLSHQEIKAITNEHITLFASLLRQILNLEFNSHPGYANTLQRINQCIQPSKESAANLSSSDHGALNLLPTLFSMSYGEHDKLLKAYKPHCNELSALQDLKKCLTHLELMLLPYLKNDEYPTPNAYQLFKTQERSTLNQLIVGISMSNPGLLASGQEMAGMSVNDHQERNFIYIPKEPREAYRLLVYLCIKNDFIKNKEKLKSNNPYALLDKTQTILKECSIRWRITSVHKHLSYLEAIVNFYTQGMLGLDYLIDALSQLDKSFNQTPITNWPVTERVYYFQIESFLNQKLCDELMQGLMNLDKFPLDNAKFLIEHIEQNLLGDLFNEFGFDKENAIQEMNNTIQTILAQRYETLNEFAAPEAGESEAQNLRLMAKLIMRDINKSIKIFEHPFLNQIDVSKILIDQELKFFTLQVENMNNSKESELIPVEDAFDFYNTVLKLYDMVKAIHPDFKINLNLVQWFNRQFNKWLNALDDKANGWVELAIKYDQFKETSEMALHSSSVDDLLQCFREQLDFVHKLIWPNDLLESRLMAKVAKVIYEGVNLYAHEMETLFNKEMEENFSNEHEKGSQWNLLAKTQKGIQDQREFKKEMCIKINNLYQLRKRIQELFSNLDYARYSKVLAEYQKQQENGEEKVTMFYINIVMAEFLKECDIGKDNDAYTILKLNDEKIFTTSIQWDSALPRWNETCGISLHKAEKLKVEVFDKDYIKDDLCGEGYLNLDPEGDWSTEDKDIWVELQPQGRILLSISTADEKDDPQYYVSKALKLLEMKERDLLHLILEKLSEEIKVNLSRKSLLKELNKRKQSVLGKFLNKKASAQGQEFTEEECDQALWNLCNYLDIKLNLPYTYLYPPLGHKFINSIWKECLLSIEACTVPSFSVHKQVPKPLTKTEFEFCMMAVEVSFI